MRAKMVKCQKDSECVLVRLTGHSTVYAPWLACHPVCIKQGQGRVPGVEENLRQDRAGQVRPHGPANRAEFVKGAEQEAERGARARGYGERPVPVEIRP